jgi:hypothetical protein
LATIIEHSVKPEEITVEFIRKFFLDKELPRTLKICPATVLCKNHLSIEVIAPGFPGIGAPLSLSPVLYFIDSPPVFSYILVYVPRV